MSGFWLIVQAVIGVLASAWVLRLHMFRKDGMGRIFILIYTVTMLAYYGLRLLSLLGYHVFGQLAYWEVMNGLAVLTNLILLPLLAILYIEYFYNHKDK